MEAKKEIALWAGIPCACVLIFILTIDQSSDVQRTLKKVDTSFRAYETLYVLQQTQQQTAQQTSQQTPSDTLLPFDAARIQAQDALEQQHAETAQAMALLVPAIPPQYARTSTYTQASARLTEDIATVRNLARRSSIDIPETSIFETGMSVESAVFTQELVYLYMYRIINELCITDSAPGVLTLTELKKNALAYCNADKSIAVFSMNVSMDIGFRRLERLLRLLDSNSKGLCVTSCDIDVLKENADDGSATHNIVRAQICISLLTPYLADAAATDVWNLQQQVLQQTADSEAGDAVRGSNGRSGTRSRKNSGRGSRR